MTDQSIPNKKTDDNITFLSTYSSGLIEDIVENGDIREEFIELCGVLDDGRKFFAKRYTDLTNALEDEKLRNQLDLGIEDERLRRVLRRADAEMAKIYDLVCDAAERYDDIYLNLQDIGMDGFTMEEDDNE